jgi:spermidine dehydrogenase
MKDKVTRRDFLNGTQVAIGASLLSPWTDVFGADPEKFALGPDYYPPAKTGLRGSHEGSWETMHAKVSGATWARTSPEEQYDLVVVGGGISGLSAAHFYRQARPDATTWWSLAVASAVCRPRISIARPGPMRAS